MENDKTLFRIKTLTELHGAPGFEEEVRDYMKQEMTPFVDEVILSLIHISEPTRRTERSRMASSA